MSAEKIIRAAVVGASGYTGAELVRILWSHKNVEIKYLIANSSAGSPISEIYPALEPMESKKSLPDLTSMKDDTKWEEVDVVFCCLPHGESQKVMSTLAKHEHLKIIDLSADFRIKDAATYEKWYKVKHEESELLQEAVYGLTEINREKIKDARIVACPGCYPTSVLIPLIPLLKEKKISPRNIIIDAKSGVTGAGRKAAIPNLFAEVNENIRPYGVGGHRHVAEIEQELTTAAGEDVVVTFTPQVIPINRGILSCMYVEMEEGVKAEDLEKVFNLDKYTSTFVIAPLYEGGMPTVRRVKGSNFILMKAFDDRVEGKAIIISAIDNLVKGASGQAVQNMNIMFDLPKHDEGLEQIPLFP